MFVKNYIRKRAILEPDKIFHVSFLDRCPYFYYSSITVDVVFSWIEIFLEVGKDLSDNLHLNQALHVFITGHFISEHYHKALTLNTITYEQADLITELAYRNTNLMFKIFRKVFIFITLIINYISYFIHWEQEKTLVNWKNILIHCYIGKIGLIFFSKRKFFII